MAQRILHELKDIIKQNSRWIMSYVVKYKHILQIIYAKDMVVECRDHLI